MRWGSRHRCMTKRVHASRACKKTHGVTHRHRPPRAPRSDKRPCQRAQGNPILRHLRQQVPERCASYDGRRRRNGARAYRKTSIAAHNHQTSARAMLTTAAAGGDFKLAVRCQSPCGRQAGRAPHQDAPARALAHAARGNGGTTRLPSNESNAPPPPARRLLHHRAKGGRLVGRPSTTPAAWPPSPARPPHPARHTQWRNLQGRTTARAPASSRQRRAARLPDAPTATRSA